MKAVIFCFGALALTGCADDLFHDPDKPDSSPEKLTWEKIPTTAENPATPYVVKVDRVFQWFKVQYCDGTIQDERRTIKDPYRRLEIKPKTNRSVSIKDSDVYNSTTDDWRECQWNICKKNQFDAHTSRGVSQTVHVLRGKQNTIEYAFRFSNGKKEEGIRYIHIDYSERTVEKVGKDCACANGCK